MSTYSFKSVDCDANQNIHTSLFVGIEAVLTALHIQFKYTPCCLVPEVAVYHKGHAV